MHICPLIILFIFFFHKGVFKFVFLFGFIKSIFEIHLHLFSLKNKLF